MLFSELSSTGLEDFHKFGIVVAKYNRFPDYYIEYLNNVGRCLYYTQYQEFLWMIKDSRFRYIEFDMEDGDKVCVFYKCIFYAKRLKFYDIPISKNGNIDNVRKVMKGLLEKSFISSFVLDDKSLKTVYPDMDLDKVSRNFMSDNFYLDLEYINSKLTNRYRSKYGLNRLDKHLKYKFFDNCLDDDSRQVALSIREAWANNAQDPGEFREFRNSLNFNSENLVFLITYYDDDPVSISILLNCGKFFIEEFCYSKARSKFEDKSKQISLQNIVVYIKKLEIEYMMNKYGTDLEYVLGSGRVSETDGLYINKKRNSKGFHKYYELKGCDIC